MLSVKHVKQAILALFAMGVLSGCLGEHPDNEPGAVNNPHPDVSVDEGSQITFDPVDTDMVYSVPVTLSRAAPESGSIRFRTISGSALPGRDYEETEQTVTFEAGQRQVGLPVQIINDTQRTADRNFRIELTRASNAFLTDQVTHQIVISGVSGDSSRPSLSLPAQQDWIAPISETAHFSVVIPLSEAVISGARVEIRSVDGTARQGIHFEQVTGENCDDNICRIEAGRSELAFFVPVMGQLGGEPRQFKLQFLNAQGLTLPDNREIEVNLTYSSEAGVATLNVPSSLSLRMPTEERSPLSYPIVLTLSEPLSEEATVEWRTVDNTAFAGTHYVAIDATGEQATTVPPGAREVGFDIEVLHDQTLEENLSFEIQLVSSVGLALGEDRRITIDMVNSNGTAEDEPTLSLPSGLLFHEPAASREYNMLVPLSEAMPASGSVQVTLIEQTARDGIDFNAYSEAIEIPRFATELEVPVTLLHNPAPTETQSFRVELSQARGVNLPTTRAFEVEIVDASDAAPYPRLQLTPDLIRVPAPMTGTDSNTVTLYFDFSDELPEDATVFVRSRNGSAAEGIDFNGLGRTLALSEEDTMLAVEIELLASGAGSAREFELVFSNAQGVSLPESRSVTVQIDPRNTPALPDLAVPQQAVSLFAPAGPDAAERVIVLPFTDFAPLRGMVTVSTQDQSAAAGEDYVLIDSDIEFDAGAREAVIRLSVEPTSESLTFELILQEASNVVLPITSEERVISVEIEAS